MKEWLELGGEDKSMQDLMIGRIGTAVDGRVRRVLVDRLWPRGVSKATAPWDVWLKEIAPSNDLRKWYGHEPERYAEFRQRYWHELESRRRDSALDELVAIWREHPVMLLTATKDLESSQVPVLRDFLLQLEGKQV